MPVVATALQAARLTLALVFALGLLSCSAGSTVPVAEYPARLVGGWQGTVGDTKESITFDADGSFRTFVRPTGFISNTLGQGVTGMIYGAWTIAGNVVTLKVESSDERIVNRTTTGTIEKFRDNEIVVKSSNGTVTTFVRLL